MSAEQTRLHHIAQVNHHLQRLAGATATFKANTAKIQNWGWVEDWQALARDVQVAADRAEELASLSTQIAQRQR